MGSTVRMRSAIEKPFSQRRRSTGQLQKAFQPDTQADFKDSGETGGDNLRTIHENCYGSQTPPATPKDSARIQRRTSCASSRVGFEARHKLLRLSSGYESGDTTTTTDSKAPSSPLHAHVLSERSSSSFSLCSEKSGEGQGSLERGHAPLERTVTVERSRSSAALLGSDRYAQNHTSPSRTYMRSTSRCSLQLPADLTREVKRVPDHSEEGGYLDGIERQTCFEEELERDVVKLEAFLCIWRERYKRATTVNTRLKKTLKDAQSTHKKRLFRLNEKQFEMRKENEQLRLRNDELMSACSLVIDRSERDRRRHEQQMRDVSAQVKSICARCKTTGDKSAARQSERNDKLSAQMGERTDKMPAQQGEQNGKLSAQQDANKDKQPAQNLSGEQGERKVKLLSQKLSVQHSGQNSNMSAPAGERKDKLSAHQGERKVNILAQKLSVQHGEQNSNLSAQPLEPKDKLSTQPCDRKVKLLAQKLSVQHGEQNDKLSAQQCEPKLSAQRDESIDTLSDQQVDRNARASGGSLIENGVNDVNGVNGASDVDLSVQCYETLLEIALARIRFLEQDVDSGSVYSPPPRPSAEQDTVFATECKKITQSISAMIQSDNEDDDGDGTEAMAMTRARSPRSPFALRSFRSSWRNRRTRFMATGRPKSTSPSSATTQGKDDDRPRFTLDEDIDDSTSVQSIDSVLSSLINRLQETATDVSTNRLSTPGSGRHSTSGYPFTRSKSAAECRTEVTTDAESVSIVGFAELTCGGRQMPEPESDNGSNCASGFAALRQRRNGVAQLRFPNESKQKKGKAREFTDAIRRFTISTKSRDCEKKRTSIHSVFKTLSS